VTPTISRDEDGALLFTNLAPWFVSVLLELPSWLEQDKQDDTIKQRLFPDPSDDEKQREDWRKYVHPELFALLADAREIVMRDLGELIPADEGAPLGAWQMRIAAEHVNGWISALNAARLAIGAKHGIEEEDMVEEQIEPEEFDDKRLAVTKIHLLGWLQQIIIEDLSPPPEGLVVPDCLPPDIG